MRDFSSTSSGKDFRKSTLSESMKLLRRWVGDDGLATMRLIFRSAGASNLMYSELCSLMALLMDCDL